MTFGASGSIAPALQVAFADGSAAHYVASMQVGPGAAPADCSRYCHVTFPFEPAAGPGCATSAEVGLVLAEADCFHRRGSVYSTTGRVRVNGLDLYPITGGRIEIDAGARSLRSSGALVTLQVRRVHARLSARIEWDDLGGADGVAEMPNVIPGPTTSVEGFGITGRLGVTFREHRATFDAHIEMPDGVGGFDAQLRLTVTAENPATLDELRVSLPVGELQDTLPIDHLLLDYEAAANRWLGDVGVSIGDYDVGAAIGFHTIPQAGLDQLRASLGGLNVSIYAGVFLQEIRFDYADPPPELGGGIALSYSPEYYDRSLVAVDGNFHLGLSDPVVIRIDGEGRILGLKVAAVDSRYSTDGNFSFDASVRVGVNPIGPPRPPWSGGLRDAAVRPPGGRSARLDRRPARHVQRVGGGAGLLRRLLRRDDADVLDRHRGCAHLGAGSVGGGYTWVTRRFDWLAGACDLGPWTVARSSGAHAAQAERALTLPRGLSVAAFKVTGEGAAPRVTVTGPKGERILTPPGVNGAKTANSLVTMDPAGHTTYVAVGSPSAGKWKITADPGSAPITAAGSARALPDVSVAAKLGGKGRRRPLRYRVKPLPGQTVVFSERSRTLTHRDRPGPRDGPGRCASPPAPGPRAPGGSSPTSARAACRAPTRSRSLATARPGPRGPAGPAGSRSRGGPAACACAGAPGVGTRAPTRSA